MSLVKTVTCFTFIETKIRERKKKCRFYQVLATCNVYGHVISFQMWKHENSVTNLLKTHSVDTCVQCSLVSMVTSATGDIGPCYTSVTADC